MWLSVATDVTTSAPSIGSEDGSKSTQEEECSAKDRVGTGTGLGHYVDQDSCKVTSSDCDVINTDNDSGAIDDADLTASDGVSVTPGPFLDGGYGWLVVIASFFNAFIFDGVGSCYGLIYPHVMEKYGASAWVASFAGSLFNALLIMGSVSVMLVRKYGYRKVTMSGGILACLAFLLSSRSPNVVCFVLSYGLFTGCACGLVFLPSVVIVNGYFHEKRGLANGIITSGSGAGLLVLAQLVNYLLEEFSLDGSLLVLAGVMLNMCVFSSLYRPPAGKPARSPDKGSSREEAAPFVPGSGSTDSGLLSTPSLSPSMETISSAGRDLDGSDDNNTMRHDEAVAADDACKQSLNSEKKQVWRKREKDYSENENTACSGREQTDNEGNGVNKAWGLQCMMNQERANHTLTGNNRTVDDNRERDVSTAQPYNSNSTELGKKPADPEVKSHHYVICKSLLPNKALQRPCGAERDSHQLWVSAYNIPTHPASFRSDAMHSSAHDVTHWGSTGISRSRTTRGLVPLAEKSLCLRHPRYQRQSRSCYDYHQIKAGQHFQGHKDQYPNHRSCYFNLLHHDLQLLPHHGDRQFHAHRRRHHQHDHHASHLSELDQGSNLYLTGSISTLRNLQSKHILHLATSQDAGQFSVPEPPFFQKPLGPKYHLNHGSKSYISYESKPHTSESWLNILEPLPIPAKANCSRGFKSHLSQQNIALLPAEKTASSFYRIPNKDFPEPFLPISSKHSLEALSGVPYHPIQTQNTHESSLPVSQLSLDLEEEKVAGAIGLEDTRQNSLVLQSSGYSLRQLLRMPCFHLFCIGSCLIQIGYPIPSIFLADLAYHQGLTTADTTIIMGVMGGLNIAGRLLSGLLANLGVNPLTLLYTSLLLGGVVCLLTPFYTTLWSLVLFAGLFGFLLGAFPPVQPLVIVEYFGLNSLASVFGLLTTIKGASSMLGPPLAGLVYDASGQYPMSFVFGGVVFLLSAAVHLAMPFFRPK